MMAVMFFTIFTHSSIAFHQHRSFMRTCCESSSSDPTTSGRSCQKRLGSAKKTQGQFPFFFAGDGVGSVKLY